MTDEYLKTLIASLAKEMAEEHKKTEAALASLAEEHKKTEAAQQRTEAVIASLAEEHKKTEAVIASLAEEHKKTEAAQQKTEAAQQKTESSIRELNKNLGGIGITLGGITEDLFRRNVAGILEQRGIRLDSLEHNLKMPDAEFDLVGFNGSQVILIEVKSRLQVQDIDALIFKQIPTFRRYFNDYKDHKLMGGLASLAIDEKLEKQVEKAGLFLFTQTKEGGASIANGPGFHPKFY